MVRVKHGGDRQVICAKSKITDSDGVESMMETEEEDFTH
jgi:hypothetical protein